MVATGVASGVLLTAALAAGAFVTAGVAAGVLLGVGSAAKETAAVNAKPIAITKVFFILFLLKLFFPTHQGDGTGKKQKPAGSGPAGLGLCGQTGRHKFT
jgi:hypothetical protein